MSNTKHEHADGFDRAWEIGARRGQCDALGGAEYRRVRRAWDRHGCTASAVLFIRAMLDHVATIAAPEQLPDLGPDLPELPELPELPDATDQSPNAVGPEDLPPL